MPDYHTQSDLEAWLRATIEGDKALAEAVEDPAEISMGAEFVDNCGSDEAAEHIRRHDTRDTIARCEAELALLDDFEEAKAYYGKHISAPAGELHGLRSAVERIASGYRHRPGFKPEWTVLP
jgi:hypothetical protein